MLLPLLTLLLAAAPRSPGFGPQLADYDRITVRVLNVGLPSCGADLLCSPRLSHVSGFVTRFKVPARVVFDPALPKNSIGKISKRDIRQRMANSGLF